MAQQVWHERIVANLECCCLCQKGTECRGSGIDEAASGAGYPAPMKTVRLSLTLEQE